MEKRLNGFYTTRSLANDTFRVELECKEDHGGWYGYDYINFPSRGVHVDTPAGYPSTVEGAYSYAGKIFGTVARA